MEGAAAMLHDREEVKNFYLDIGGGRRAGFSEWRAQRSEAWLD